ncbi:TIGR03086 family metal-binding protein [Stackebrandtia soli]|uniref:TIGR03086 family metal-binding protein n=1 Tax=Stackebrandtia soli TaxID=1892856 RepID=UPI0039EA8B84
MTDQLDVHRRTMAIAQSVVDQVEVRHLALPTPCAAWNLGELLAHMVGQNHGFAAAARGGAADRALWVDRPVGDDPVGAFRVSVSDVVSAFAEPESVARDWWLAEFSTERRFPAQRAIGFHLLDYLVHAWDVAVTIGAPIAFDPDMEYAVLEVAEAIPDGPGRLDPGAAFRPSIALVRETSTLDRILTLLGRSPSWSDGRT